MTAKDYKKEYEKFRALPLIERLRQHAKTLRKQADQFKGCTWLGDFPPGLINLHEASDLEEAANIIERKKL